MYFHFFHLSRMDGLLDGCWLEYWPGAGIGFYYGLELRQNNLGSHLRVFYSHLWFDAHFRSPNADESVTERRHSGAGA
jgi:hypothetical protein